MNSTLPEFSHLVDRRRIDRRVQHLAASPAQRAALAKRFGIVSISRLEAELELLAQGDIIHVTGRFEAGIVQSCAISGDDLAVSIAEPIALRFVPPREQEHEEEIELDEAELDEIEYSGTEFDIGEAVAQSLALAIDPYLTGPQAAATRKRAGLLDAAEAGPFAALAALKKRE